jgi:glycosyltransferase involved in cell wall biosynthesis
VSTLLAFTENYRRGGGARYLVDFVNAAPATVERIVIASNPGAVAPEEIAGIGRPVAVVPARFATAARAVAEGGPLAGLRASLVRAADPLAFDANVRSLEALVRETDARTVIAFNGGHPAARSNLAMVVAARRAGARAMLSVVGTPVPRRPRLAGYETKLDTRVWEAVDAIVVNAHAVGEVLETLRGAPRGKLRLVRNGLADTPHVRAPGMIAPEPVIGCVSRLDVEKGALDLLEAFAVIAPEFPHARLRMIGEGDARAAVLDRARALGLDGRVEAPGRRDGDVAATVAAFDLYAFASHHEGFPYAILEAMRAGCPIVTTGVGGIPEAVRDGVDGLVVPPRNPGTLAAALRRLLADPALRAACARSARARFLAEFSLEVMRRAVHALLDDSPSAVR